MGRQLAMHAAGMKSQFLKRADVPPELLDKEKAILAAQASGPCGLHGPRGLHRQVGHLGCIGKCGARKAVQSRATQGKSKGQGCRALLQRQECKGRSAKAGVQRQKCKAVSSVTRAGAVHVVSAICHAVLAALRCAGGRQWQAPSSS